jgi:cytochrome c5
VMVKRAIEGYKAMPPRGTCTTCSDDDIKKTVEYMVSHSQ